MLGLYHGPCFSDFMVFHFQSCSLLPAVLCPGDLKGVWGLLLWDEDFGMTCANFVDQNSQFLRKVTFRRKVSGLKTLTDSIWEFRLYTACPAFFQGRWKKSLGDRGTKDRRWPHNSSLIPPYILPSFVPSKTELNGGSKRIILWDFPDSPVVKILTFQCRGPGFNPWSGN